MQLNQIQRVEICGNIASGKTTLSHSLMYYGMHVINEIFLDNPFLNIFYKNPKLYSFETEITFLLQHYHAIKTANNAQIVCDYSLTLDKAYADVTLTPTRRKIFLNITEELESEIGLPATIIYLKCPEEILLNRIRSRNRSFELSIDIGYLKSLSEAIHQRVEEISREVEIICIDSYLTNFIDRIQGISELERFVS